MAVQNQSIIVRLEKMKLAVHLHLFHVKQLPWILRYLENLDDCDYDLFVTLVEHDEQIESTLKAFNPHAIIIIVPNRGYDLGPFVEFLHKVDLDKYNYILKVHTKAPKSNNFTMLNGYSMSNRLWNYVLWDSVLGSKEQVQKCLTELTCEGVGMVGSKICLTEEKRTYEELLPQINEVLEKLNFAPVDKIKFVAGTMFYVRAELMKPLLAYTINDFAPSDGTIKNYTLGHVFERVVALLVTGKGLKITGVGSARPMQLFFKLLLAQTLHFLWQNKRTKSGAHIIKICRIPVYHKKEK